LEIHIESHNADGCAVPVEDGLGEIDEFERPALAGFKQILHLHRFVQITRVNGIQAVSKPSLFRDIHIFQQSARRDAHGSVGCRIARP